MTLNEKIFLLAIWGDEEEIINLIKDRIPSTTLIKEGYVREKEDSYVTTEKGSIFAKKLQSIGINYEVVAESGSVSNAMSMLGSAIKALHTKISKGEIKIYSGRPLEELLLECLADIDSMLDYIPRQEDTALDTLLQEIHKTKNPDEKS